MGRFSVLMTAEVAPGRGGGTQSPIGRPWFVQAAMINRKCLVSWIPGVNLLYHVLVEHIPTRDSIIEMMNLIALLDALMLSVVCGYPSWASYDDLEEANNRFRNEWRCHYWYGIDNISTHYPNKYFSMCVARNMTIANVMLGLALVVNVMTYMSLTTLGGDQSDATDAQVKRWWRNGGMFTMI